jgi:hypothetical protein
VSDFDLAGSACGRNESWRLQGSYSRIVSNGVHREVRFLQIQLCSTSGLPANGPAAIDVAETIS